MAEYTNTQPDLTLSSDWNCHTSNLGGGAFAFRIVRGPTTGYGAMVFPVEIPEGVYVSRAWLSFSPSYPMSGAAVKAVNGYYIPPSNVVELDRGLFTPATTEYTAQFSFRANGKIFEDYSTHTSYWTAKDPTLHIEYYDDEGSMPGIEIVQDTSNTSDNDPSDGRFFLPRLLDANMDEKARLRPSALSLDLNLNPLSTAHMRLPDGESAVTARDMVELFAPSGSVGTYRVSEVERVRGVGGGQDVYLEHALVTLSDSLAIGVQAMTGPVAQVVATLLEAQTVFHWVLGDCDVPIDFELIYDYTDDNLLKALMGVLELLPEGYVPEFNTRVHPFVLHIRKADDEAFCEARMSRNMASVREKIDASDLCTRVYPYGAGEGTNRIELTGLTGQAYMDADTVDTWGLVAKTFVNEDIYDALTLQEVAQKYLEKHKNPTHSIEIDGFDLYAATDEDLDRFRLGRMCRVPLPQSGVVMYDRVVAKHYPDVYNKPDKVTVTLANKMRTIGDEIAGLFRDVTQSKLLGGSIKAEEITASPTDVTPEAPRGLVFEVKEYGNLIACRLTYQCFVSGTSDPAECVVYVDGEQVPRSEDKGGVVDVLNYLKRDTNGVIVVGNHSITLGPMGAQGTEHYMKIRLLLKTVERK